MGTTGVCLWVVLFFWIRVRAANWTIVVSCRGKPLVSCGDNLCWCCPANDAGDEPDTAICKREGMTYIPRLPDSVRYLIFQNSNLSAVTLTEQFFSNVTQVMHLEFLSNNVRHVGPNVFSGFKNLKRLDFTGNVGLTFDSVRNMLEIPGLRTFVALSCHLPEPPYTAFSSIRSDVDTLMLSTWKAGKEYDMTAFCSLKNLRDITIRQGIVIKVKTTCTLQIHYLKINYNFLLSFPVTCYEHSKSYFPHLRTLVLAGNLITHIAKACLPELTVLDLSQNSFRIFFSGSFYIKQFQNLRELIVSDVAARGIHLDNNSFSHPTLQRLVLTRCNINFSDRIQVSPDAFAGLPMLTEISLMYNEFGSVDDKRFLELFGSLNLTMLQLSFVDLSAISWNALAHFQNMRRLELVNTRLSDLPDGVFSSLKHLTWLDMSDNKIATVTQTMFKEETKQHLQFLGLDKNPFTCSCDLLWFKNWFVSQPTLFFNKESRGLKYKCYNRPGTKLADFMMADQACLLSQSVNVAIILVTSAMIVTITTVSLVFRFRWHIRLALYEVFRGRGDIRRMRLHANRFDYDVFVSYTKEDLPWVQEHLMPELQDRLGLRLCVHERDFIPGNNIVDNIVECVQSSKKIMMVFSKDFVHSQWCQFELTFCLTHVMEYDDTLLIVCVDDVTSRDMTPAMMAVLKTTTYIQWGDHRDAVDSFWGRLRLALHEVIDMNEAVVRPVVGDRDVGIEMAEAIDRNAAAGRAVIIDETEDVDRNAAAGRAVVIDKTDAVDRAESTV